MAPAQNHLVELLPRADRQRLLALCETVPLALGEILCERGDPVHHAYFPVDAVISLVMRIENHPSVEVGMIGHDGMVGAPLILEVNMMPLRAVVQATGTAWRVTGADFRRELASSAPLRQLIQRFMYVHVAQMASAAACLRFHLIEPRLARWLLMSQDRAQATHLHVTHELLACMLGVRRVGITAAAGALQRAGLIVYHRGELRVLDRPGLERAACSCYAADTAAYRQHLGSAAQFTASERRAPRA